MTPALSVCMIVRDEETQLPRCLNSVRALGGELIVVDTGSVDRTADVAAGMGARIERFDFSRTDFAAARNHSISYARGRWILVIDADEVLDAASASAIQALVAGYDNVGYYFERRNETAAGESLVTDYVVRLFPNRPHYRYRGRVHETIDASILSGGGRLQKTGIVLHHRFAADPESRRTRNHRYIEILKEEITADPSDHSRFDFLAAEYHQLGMFNEAASVAEHIARVRPLDAQAHLFAGIYHLVYQTDPARARGDFQTALKLRPGYPEAASFLRLAEERCGISSPEE